MVPLVGTLEELRRTREVIDRVAQEVFKETKTKVSYLVGTMIEVPRAALTAGQIAQSADFFSFGTNDLTQNDFGVSRDDAEASSSCAMWRTRSCRGIPSRPWIETGSGGS